MLESRETLRIPDMLGDRISNALASCILTDHGSNKSKCNNPANNDFRSVIDGVGHASIDPCKRYKSMNRTICSSDCSVELAMDTVTGQLVACKRVAQLDVARKEGLAHAALTALKHPHIAKFCDMYEESGALVLVGEYCEGGDLIDLITCETEEGMDSDLALRLCAQLLDALTHIHRAGYAHGDIKIDNCCIDANGNLKLIDFGCTVAIKDLQGGLFKPGSSTFAYTAPEVFAGRCKDPRSADVWAVGITLFAMLTGELPWGMASSRDHAYFRHWRGDHIPGWEIIPNDIRTILASMLDVSGETRISAEDAHSSICRVLSARALAA